jgi:hypothetical protein
MPRNNRQNNRRNNANENGEYRGHSSFTLSGYGHLARQPRVFFNQKDGSYSLRTTVVGFDGQAVDTSLYCGTFKRAQFLGGLPAGTPVGFTGALDVYNKTDARGNFLSKEVRVRVSHIDPLEKGEDTEKRWSARIAKGDTRMPIVEGVGTVADGGAAPVAGVAGFTAEQMAGLGNLLAAFAAGGTIAAAPAAAPAAAAPIAEAAPAAEVATLASAIADEGEAFDVEEEAVEG